MMEAIQVIRIDFDNMENRNAEYETLLGTFIEGGTASATGNASKFIETLPLRRTYLGWDGKVYPQYKLTKIQISNDGNL